MPMPKDWRGSDGRSRAEVCLWLKMHGGEYHDPNGLITGTMKADLNKGRALSQLLADMEHDGMIEREIRGRRTLRIKLLDDWGLADDLSAQPVFRPPSAQPTTTGEPDYDQLAAALLKQVLERSRVAPSNGAEIERLREQVAELKIVKQALTNVTAERDDFRIQADKMRESLIELKASMDRKPKKGGVPIRDIIDPKDRALLDRLMREVPTR